MSFAEPITMPRSNGEMARYGSDTGLHVEFFMRPVYMEFLSEKAGREIWEDRPFVTIAQPGAKSDLTREVPMEDLSRMIPIKGTPNRISDPERFPRHWEAFRSQNEQAQTGLPLEQCAFISKSRVLEFKAQKIHTCEQLSELPDSIVQTLGLGARELRDQAKAYLDDAQRVALLRSSQAEARSLRDEMEAMRQQLALLSAAQNGVVPAPLAPASNAVVPDPTSGAENTVPYKPRGPGRPRKEVEE